MGCATYYIADILLSFAQGSFPMCIVSFCHSDLGRVEPSQSFKQCPKCLWNTVVHPALVLLKKEAHGQCSFFPAEVVMGTGVLAFRENEAFSYSFCGVLLGHIFSIAFLIF